MTSVYEIILVVACIFSLFDFLLIISNRISVKVFWITSLLIILLYRISHYTFITFQIPDQARSLYFGGQQVHHIYIGLIVYILIRILLYKTKQFSKLQTSVTAFSIASIADQLTYIMFTNLSDKSYSSLISIFGVFGVYSIIYMKFNFTRKTRKYK